MQLDNVMVLVPDADTMGEDIYIVTDEDITVRHPVCHISKIAFDLVRIFLTKDNQWETRIRPLFTPDAKHNLPVWEDGWLEKLKDEFFAQVPLPLGNYTEADINNTIYMFLCGYVPFFSASPRTKHKRK